MTLSGHDFVGVFAVLRRGERTLLVANDREIGGALQRTWDLPGGRVEPRERLVEALRRELFEETQMTLVGEPEFAFVQEGERVVGGGRRYVWRSFFFEIEAVGEPVASSEVLDTRWLTGKEIGELCQAPYHDSFKQWSRAKAGFFSSDWTD